MQSSLRFGALLATADGLAVGTASKKPAVQSLMESAKHMLKNGATPAVIDYTDQLIQEIEGEVVPAILRESDSDQTFILRLYDRFTDVFNALRDGNLEVYRLNAEETAYSEQHKQCRNEEHHEACYGCEADRNGDWERCNTCEVRPHPEHLEGHCEGKRDCEMELYRRWSVWVDEETTLRGIHETILGHFCPPDANGIRTEANGTLHTFRLQSVPWMESYMTQKVIVDEAEHAYDIKVPDCVAAHTHLDDVSASCNALQNHLERTACAHAAAINQVLQSYYEDYARAQAAYNCAEEEVRQLERDRHREYETLKVVHCLLDRIREQNGVPCDSETGVTEQVGHCEAIHHELDVCAEAQPVTGYANGNTVGDVLCLEYPEVPCSPPVCESRHEVVGVCLPVVQPIPCNADWDAQEGPPVLPGYPEAIFSETNPGCNAYPACQCCPPMPDPHPIIIDTCPGYTIDGCPGGNGADEHPLTFIRNVDGVADVRCCSNDGSQCQSQNFDGGVDFPTPNGGMHHGCYFDQTYQEAMTICHNAGMRICSVEEISACCNTGCWHNEHNIWVNMQDAGMTLDQRYNDALARTDLDMETQQSLQRDTTTQLD